MKNCVDKGISNAHCAVIVAHPDDETLWAGGTILMNPSNQWDIVTLCRKSDPDRYKKFFSALKILNAEGSMGDLDDGPDQLPLDPELVSESILALLPGKIFDLIITHSPRGEYTRHRRHEEVAEAVVRIIESKRLRTRSLWMFAYEDGNKQYLPMPIEHADRTILLPQTVWNKKYHIMTEIYGFTSDSWEARTTPRKESFWMFCPSCRLKEPLRERSGFK